MERCVVAVSEDVIDLVPGFLARRQTDVEQLRDELKHGDSAAISFRAHTMKGSSGSFGFDHLSQLAARLEQTGKSADLPLAAELIDAIAAHLENLEVVSE